MKLKINDITIPPDRQRRQLDEAGLQKLADSLSVTGQIQSIVVDANNILVCGLRRIKAARLNGWTEIEAKLVDELDDLEREIMEFEENLQREDLSVADEIAAQKRLHELYTTKYGEFQPENLNKGVMESSGWRQQSTAELLGINPGQFSVNLQLAEAIERDPELGKLKTRAAIVRVVEQRQEEGLRKVVVALEVGEPVVHGGATGEIETKSVSIGLSTVCHGDSRVALRAVEDESINLTLTDPLWDVEFDDEIGTFDEGPLDVITKVMEECFRIMKDGTHGFMFFGMKRYEHYIRMLFGRGFIVDRIPLIWYKPGGGFARDPSIQIKNDYESCFHFFKPPRPKFLKPLTAVHTHTISNQIHKAEKPVEMLSKLIEATTVEGELVVDPFAGSGSTLEAASRMGRRSIGVEIQEDSFNKCILRLKGA